MCVCVREVVPTVYVCVRERERGGRGRERKGEHEGSFLNEMMHPSIPLSRGRGRLNLL